MSLKAKITDDMKAAMRAKDAPRLSAIRLLLSAMKQKEVDERVELSDTDIVTIIDKMLKPLFGGDVGSNSNGRASPVARINLSSHGVAGILLTAGDNDLGPMERHFFGNGFANSAR